jgi:hypothetical protein
VSLFVTLDRAAASTMLNVPVATSGISKASLHPFVIRIGLIHSSISFCNTLLDAYSKNARRRAEGGRGDALQGLCHLQCHDDDVLARFTDMHRAFLGATLFTF